MALMNGNLLYRSKEFVIETFGQEKFDKILSEMENSSKNILSKSINSSAMYDVNVYQEFLRASEKILGRAEIQKMSRYCFKKQITGFYGIVLKFISLGRVLKSSQQMWDKTYNEGKVEIINKDNTKFIMKVSEFEWNESMMYGFMYYIQALVEEVAQKKVICSCKNIDQKTTEFTFIVLLN